MNVFISGGCKNGKSYFAQSLAKWQAAENRPLYYIATMHPVDGEDQARILRHREERQGWGFSTIEKSTEIGRMEADFTGSFLLDSVTALLSNEMFRRDGTIDHEAHRRIAEELTQLAQQSNRMVFVSDYIYSDAERYDELTELYRKGLAWIDRTLARVCDVVIEVAFGRIQIIKGPANFMESMDIQEIQSMYGR
ncbi:MAG: hypothetical protein K0Q48_866 [Bacillota bacterium]|nr:hypothetical protein [Bacillota bacterium]